jgi:hypothetical protein
MIKESGSAVSVSPGSELRIGYGCPQISEMLAKGSPLGISVDTSALIGSSNLFDVLKPAHPAWAGDASGSRLQEIVDVAQEVLQRAGINAVIG